MKASQMKLLTKRLHRFSVVRIQPGQPIPVNIRMSKVLFHLQVIGENSLENKIEILIICSRIEMKLN